MIILPTFFQVITHHNRCIQILLRIVLDRTISFTIIHVFRVLIHENDVEHAWIEPNILFDVYKV